MANQDDDQKKKQQQAAQPIGKPIIPQQDQGEASQPPDVQAPPPVQVQGSIGTPLYPTPAQEKASQVEQAPYHPGTGMRVLDAVGRVIPAVGDVEAGAGIGMPGYSQRMSQAEAASKSEQEREKAAEGEQKNNAEIGAERAAAGKSEAEAGEAAARGKLAESQAANLNEIVGYIQGPTGQPLPIYKGQAGKVATTQMGDTSKDDVQAGKNKTELTKDAADNASKERIAQWRSRTSEEVAQTRASFQQGTLHWGQLGGKPVMYDDKTGKIVDVGGLGPQPTAQTRAMGEQGGAISFMVPPLLEQIDALKDQIGPFAGRFDRAYVNEMGANDPAFASLDEGLQLFASGVARAHFGARGAAAATSEFKKYLTQSQSVDDLKARINTADAWMLNYAKLAGAPSADAAHPAQGQGGQSGGITIDRDANERIIGVR